MFDIPDSIKNLIYDEMYSIDDVGMSDSTVIVFSDRILKIQPISEEATELGESFLSILDCMKAWGDENLRNATDSFNQQSGTISQ